MDWGFVVKYAPMYVRAAGLTLRIGGLGVLLSIVVGFACSFVRYRRIPLLNRIAGIYIELARNTPLLIQLFFLYFGLPKIGLKLSAGTCAVVGLSFLGGAYMAEGFRSGMEAVEKSQIEAGLCLGLTGWQNLRYVILPQALAFAVPALCANVIFLLKETSAFSAVALADLMYVAKDLIGMYYKTDEAPRAAIWIYAVVFFLYFIVCRPISMLAARLERRFS